MISPFVDCYYFYSLKITGWAAADKPKQQTHEKKIEKTTLLSSTFTTDFWQSSTVRAVRKMLVARLHSRVASFDRSVSLPGARVAAIAMVRTGNSCPVTVVGAHYRRPIPFSFFQHRRQALGRKKALCFCFLGNTFVQQKWCLERCISTARDMQQ